jgi:hypothetical protein
MGDILYKPSKDKEETVLTDCDLSLIDQLKPVGHSCATAESIPLEIYKKGILIK